MEERAGVEALRAFQAGDAAAVDAPYAEDPIFVNLGMEPLKGRAAIDSIHRREMAAEGYDVTWESIEIEVSESGDLGCGFGRWSADGPPPGPARTAPSTTTATTSTYTARSTARGRRSRS